jgi:hypothetical protein
MAEPIAAPTCPQCGSTMIRRERRNDGAAFWGCSTFPACRGTRELAPAAGGLRRRPVITDRPEGGVRVRYDRVVLACGAIGLLIGLGFVAVGLNSKPNTYAFVGGVLIALNALVALPSPWLPQRFARASALRVAFLSVFVAGFFIAWIPVSTWLGHAFANQMLQAVPT